MSHPDIGSTRRLLRLERVLAGRRARLETSLAGHRAEVGPAPSTALQRYGYLAAVLLAAVAVAPTVLGFTWRHRRVLSGAAMNRAGIAKLRKQFEAARRSAR